MHFACVHETERVYANFFLPPLTLYFPSNAHESNCPSEEG